MRSIPENDEGFYTIRLSPEESAAPSEVIVRFFKTYHPSNCRLLLWQMLINLLLEDNFSRPTSPSAHLRFFEELMPFIEAVFLMQQKGRPLEDQSNSNHEGMQTAKKPPEEVDSAMGAATEQAQHPLMNKSGWKRKRKHLRRHSIWFRQAIVDPFQVIKNFFSTYSLNSFRGSLYEVLAAFSADHFYQKGSPSDVLYVSEMVESMVNAGYLLNGQFDAAQAIDLKVLLQTLREQDIHVLLWEKMPSLLTSEEMADPLKVLSLFFSHKSLREWKEELIEINNLALSKHSGCEWGICVDTMAVFVWIVKLVEALYLIDVFYSNRSPN